jgi:hypothetical protein
MDGLTQVQATIRRSCIVAACSAFSDVGEDEVCSDQAMQKGISANQKAEGINVACALAFSRCINRRPSALQHREDPLTC